MQVLSLSPDQINALADSERNAIMQLVSLIIVLLFFLVLIGTSAKPIHGNIVDGNDVKKKKEKKKFIFFHFPFIPLTIARAQLFILRFSPSILAIHPLVSYSIMIF